MGEGVGIQNMVINHYCEISAIKKLDIKYRGDRGVIMSEKVGEVFLEVIFKLMVEDPVGACQMEKSRQSVTRSGKAEV